MRRPLSIIGLVLCAFAGWCAAASGAGIAVTQSVIDRSGNPLVVANFIPDGSLATASWSVCSPPDTTVCVPAQANSASFAPGPTPAGTVFQASATYAGMTTTSRSAPWLGTVQATTPPSLTGAARVGQTVTPAGATWTGGWGHEFDALGIVACRTATGVGCLTLTANEGVVDASGPIVVGSWMTGWFLFAMDWRYAAGAAFAAIAIPPFVAPVPAPGPTVARSAPLGPIAGPPPPRVSFSGTATRRGRRVLVGVVHCTPTCHASIQARDATGHQTFATAPVSGSLRVGVPSTSLGRGRIIVTVTIDGGPPILGHTTLR